MNRSKRKLIIAIVLLSMTTLGISGAFWVERNVSSRTAYSYTKVSNELKSQKKAIKEKESSMKAESEEASKQVDYLSKQVESYASQPAEQSGEYSSLYPDLYVRDKEIQKDKGKMVYLTFDDGPSELTSKVIDTLNKYGVHATFFVTVQEGREADYKAIVDNGNRIQIHTASHDYEAIYRSVNAYLDDFNTAYNYIYSVTGIRCDVFRFPGGSNNGYGSGVAKPIAAEMARRGFKYCDWNVSVGDGSAAATKDSIIQKITAESNGIDRIVMLAHDSGKKTETLAALPQVIEYYKNNGYQFGLINKNMDMSDFQFVKLQ